VCNTTRLLLHREVAAIIAIALLDFADFAVIVALLVLNASIRFADSSTLHTCPQNWRPADYIKGWIGPAISTAYLIVDCGLDRTQHMSDPILPWFECVEQPQGGAALG
jgi:hypothetical protein